MSSICPLNVSQRPCLRTAIRIEPNCQRCCQIQTRSTFFFYLLIPTWKTTPIQRQIFQTYFLTRWNKQYFISYWYMEESMFCHRFNLPRNAGIKIHLCWKRQCLRKSFFDPHFRFWALSNLLVALQQNATNWLCLPGYIPIVNYHQQMHK